MDATGTTPHDTPHDTPQGPDRGNRRFRRATAIGLTAGLLGGGAAGFMVAVPSLTSAASGAVTLQDGDTATDTATDADTDDRPERGTRLRELLQDLVDDGTITSEQADAVVAHIVEAMPDRPGRGPGRGHGSHVAGTVAADALGITVDELREALAAGQSIADVAAAQGVDVQIVIDAMLTEVEEHLDAKVADGTLTQEEADATLADATERITERVNTAGLGRMGRGPGGADATGGTDA